MFKTTTSILQANMSMVQQKLFPYLPPYVQSFLVSLKENYLGLKILSVIISLGLVILIVYQIILLRKRLHQPLEMLTESIDAPELPKKKITKQWEAILARLETEQESEYKMAVIEADKILDDLLEKIGYEGENMAERLKQITPAQMVHINEVWEAHKLRNRIVHEPDFHLTCPQARRAIEIYQKALEDLEMI